VPQGLPKKIEFNLLLSDLAFQRSDALTSRGSILAFHDPQVRIPLAGPTSSPKTFRSMPTILTAPLRKPAAADVQLTTERGSAFPAHQPFNH
jgi:hypothetical protein